jgi:single-strand DNA-binding protein
MADINVSCFSGNLGKDAVIREFTNGKGAVSFSVAYTESWKDAQDQLVEVTHWLECERIGSAAYLNYARKYYLKGQQVFVKGMAINKEWVSDGVNHRKTIFKLDDVQLVGEIKGRKNQAANPDQGSAQQPQQAQPQQAQQSPAHAPAQAPAQRPYAAAPSAAMPSYSYRDEEGY